MEEAQLTGVRREFERDWTVHKVVPNISSTIDKFLVSGINLGVSRERLTGVCRGFTMDRFIFEQQHFTVNYFAQLEARVYLSGLVYFDQMYISKTKSERHFFWQCYIWSIIKLNRGHAIPSTLAWQLCVWKSNFTKWVSLIFTDFLQSVPSSYHFTELVCALWSPNTRLPISKWLVL